MRGWELNNAQLLWETNQIAWNTKITEWVYTKGDYLKDHFTVERNCLAVIFQFFWNF